MVGKHVLLLHYQSSNLLWCLPVAQLLAAACWTAVLKWLLCGVITCTSLAAPGDMRSQGLFDMFQ